MPTSYIRSASNSLSVTDSATKNIIKRLKALNSLEPWSQFIRLNHKIEKISETISFSDNANINNIFIESVDQTIAFTQETKKTSAL